MCFKRLPFFVVLYSHCWHGNLTPSWTVIMWLGKPFGQLCTHIVDSRFWQITLWNFMEQISLSTDFRYHIFIPKWNISNSCIKKSRHHTPLWTHTQFLIDRRTHTHFQSDDGMDSLINPLAYKNRLKLNYSPLILNTKQMLFQLASLLFQLFLILCLLVLTLLY